MTLLLLAIAPGLAICIYVWLQDRYNREPIKNLVLSFIGGGLSLIPAFYIEVFLGNPTFFSMPLLDAAVLAWPIVALTEEFCKMLVLRGYAYRLKSFDEPLDGIIYSVMVAMGFATVENVMYVTQQGLGTAFIRMFLTVPAHASFAIVMGYYVGKTFFDPKKRSLYIGKGLALAVLLHGSFDYFLFLDANPEVNNSVAEGLLFAGAVASLIFSLRLGRRHLRTHQLLSEQQLKTPPRL